MADVTSCFTSQPSSPAANLLRAVAERLRATPVQCERPKLQVALGVTHAWSFDVRSHPMRIQLLEGEVMVTFEGDPVDHVLTQGAVFTTPRRGRVAVAAFRPSRFSVTAP
jgi:DUF2917 family protein